MLQLINGSNQICVSMTYLPVDCLFNELYRNPTKLVGSVPMPDLLLCLGVLKHRALLARGGGIFLPIFFYNGYLLKGFNVKFEGVLFRSDYRHNDRVDSQWECATFRAQVRGLIT